MAGRGIYTSAVVSEIRYALESLVRVFGICPSSWGILSIVQKADLPSGKVLRIVTEAIQDASDQCDIL